MTLCVFSLCERVNTHTHTHTHTHIYIYIYIYIYIDIYTSLAFAGPSSIRAGWGIETNGRFVAPSFSWTTFKWASSNLCPLCIALDFAV